MGRSSNKHKATAKEHATHEIASKDKAPQDPDVKSSEKQRSQGRFAGETPLTGEDRPSNVCGAKTGGRMARPQR
jgi:hypothetical protein